MTRKDYKEIEQLFHELSKTSDSHQQDILIENTACKFKNSIREICQENPHLLTLLQKYEG